MQRGIEEVHGRAADKTGHENVGGVGVEHLRRIDLLDDALVEHANARTHRHGLNLVVRHVDECGLQPLVQLGDLRARLDTQLGIQVRKGLVQQEHRRFTHNGASHGHALTLATRQLARPAIQQVDALVFLNQAEAARRLVDAAINFLLGGLAQTQAKGHVVVNSHVRVKRVTLEDHGHVPVLGRDVVDHAVTNQDLSGRHLLQASQHSQTGRLAAA